MVAAHNILLEPAEPRALIAVCALKGDLDHPLLCREGRCVDTMHLQSRTMLKLTTSSQKGTG